MSKTISIAGIELALCDDPKSNIEALNAIIKSALKHRNTLQSKAAKIAERTKAKEKAKAAKETKRKREAEKKAKRKDAAKARKGKSSKTRLEQLDLLSGSAT